MCLILFAYRVCDERPLVVAANRDEFYARPSRAAHWWDDGEADGNPHEEPHGGPVPVDSRPRSGLIFGGRDLEAHGTWLAVSSDGRLAAVTNWTEDRNAPKPPGSRGDLPRSFLAGEQSARDFSADVDGDQYAGFNLIAYDGDELIYSSNRTGEIRALEQGVYGLTNTRLGPGLVLGEQATPAFRTALGRYEQWPKAVFGAAALARVAETATVFDLVDLLAQPHVPLETPPDREQAPERSYSPCFIHGTDYGTRASTAVIVGNGSVEFVERQYGPHGKRGSDSATTIDLDIGPIRAGTSPAPAHRRPDFTTTT